MPSVRLCIHNPTLAPPQGDRKGRPYYTRARDGPICSMVGARAEWMSGVGPLWSPAMHVAGDQCITEVKRATRQGNGGQP